MSKLVEDFIVFGALLIGPIILTAVYREINIRKKPAIKKINSENMNALEMLGKIPTGTIYVALLNKNWVPRLLEEPIELHPWMTEFGLIYPIIGREEKILETLHIDPSEYSPEKTYELNVDKNIIPILVGEDDVNNLLDRGIYFTQHPPLSMNVATMTAETYQSLFMNVRSISDGEKFLAFPSPKWNIDLILPFGEVSILNKLDIKKV